VRERLWHPSQVASDQPDGTLLLTLNVSNDPALRSWILGFGGLARVVAPAALAAQIAQEFADGLKRYAG
jgi:predicted DNA-binding transcriptional regulator YafY